MVETVYRLHSDVRIEKVVQDENIHYIHMLFAQGDGLPVHRANSNLYMTVLRGTLTIALEGLAARSYAQGTVLMIPAGSQMDARNTNPEMLELTVVKAPAPTA